MFKGGARFMKSWSRTGKTFVVLAVIFSLITGQFISGAEVSAIEGEAVQEENDSENSQETKDEGEGDGQENPDDGNDGQETDTANLRLIFTSDIHGQVTTEDYENGTVFTTGGLSRTATLIKEAKREVDGSNFMLFDLGDSLYDYTTDYIYNYDSSTKQPV